MLKLLFTLPVALWLSFASQNLPTPTPTPAAAAKSMPADAATLMNPVTATAESQTHAKMTYKMDCSMCHGENGNGKGDLVAEMHLTMKDLTDPASLKGVPDGELFYIIRNGKGQMPAEGDRAKDADVWNLVILMRSFAKN